MRQLVHQTFGDDLIPFHMWLKDFCKEKNLKENL